MVTFSNFKGFPDSSDSKESASIAEDPGSILSQEDSLEAEIATHSSILAREFHDQGTLVTCSPRQDLFQEHLVEIGEWPALICIHLSRQPS